MVRGSDDQGILKGHLVGDYVVYSSRHTHKNLPQRKNIVKKRQTFSMTQTTAAEAASNPAAATILTPQAQNTIPSVASHGEESKDHHEDEGDTTDDTVEKKADANDDDIQKPEILSRRRFLPLYIGMLFSVTLLSLDNTIVATAQVPIVESLGGEALITWLPTTFLLGQCSFSLFFGQILTVFPSKLVFLYVIALFELGSLVSALAHNMAAMLAGRTLSGIGAAGIFMCVQQIMIETTTLATRAAYAGLLGSVFAISMVAGPLIGGSLADSVGWRWCFYINLPVGGVTIAAIVLLFNVRPALGMSRSNPPPLLTRLGRLDWVGLTLLTGIVCMVIVPMQQSQVNGWASAATLAPICLTPVVGVLTAFWFQYRQRKDETCVLLPTRLFADANYLGCGLATFFSFWIAIEFIYLIPLYYQAVLGHSALKSGVDMLGLVLTFGLSATVGGILTKMSGHYYPQLLLCPLIGILASGLMYNIKLHSSSGYHVGTQILLGLALGPMVQSPMIAAQANCPDKRLVARAMALIAFGQRFGGGVGASLTGAMLAAQLPHQIRHELRAIHVDPQPYVNISYSAIRTLPAGPIRDALLRALNQLTDDINLAGIPLFAALFFVVIFMIRIRNIKTDKPMHKRDILHAVLHLKPSHIRSSA